MRLVGLEKGGEFRLLTSSAAAVRGFSLMELLVVVAVFAFNDAPYPAPPWRGLGTRKAPG